MGNASSDAYRMYLKQTCRCPDISRSRTHDLDDSMYPHFQQCVCESAVRGANEFLIQSVRLSKPSGEDIYANTDTSMENIQPRFMEEDLFLSDVRQNDNDK